VNSEKDGLEHMPNMVFLVLTRDGLEQLKARLGGVPSPVWISHGLLSDAEIAELRSSGVQVGMLAGSVDTGSSYAIQGAVRSIQKQHPGSRVWVEHLSPAEEPAHAAPTEETKDWKRVLQSVVGKADYLFDHARLRLKSTTAFGAPFMIVPYLGYGTSNKLVLNGRVLRDDRLAERGEAGTGWQNLVELYKRLASNEVPGARVRARFQEVEMEAVADGEGYFTFEMLLHRPLDTPGWHRVQLELVEPSFPNGKPVLAEARVLVPPANARFGIISDIDDTVVWTNVTNRLRMLVMLTRSNAHTRKPFKGVAAFYRALRNGGGNQGNPIFYVSSSPWNLYTPLVEFMRVQGIPRGPLFLKDYGEHTLFSSRDHQTHKLASIEHILQAFPHLQFILIGDSGEQDPEIYSKVVKMYPERIRVIYIRNVNPDPSRIEAIDRLIEVVRQSGAQLVLAPDSEFAATHAAAEGLISRSDLDHVRSDRKVDERATGFDEPGREQDLSS
jgi:phosphatidate phosphatase APP1